MQAGITSRVTWDLRVLEEIKETKENEVITVQRAQKESWVLMDRQDLRGTRESRDRMAFQGCLGIQVAMVSRGPRGNPEGKVHQAPKGPERIRGPLVLELLRRGRKATKANPERQR